MGSSRFGTGARQTHAFRWGDQEVYIEWKTFRCHVIWQNTFSFESSLRSTISLNDALEYSFFNMSQTMQVYVYKTHTRGQCLRVTCPLHFWQNDRGLLRATVVTAGVEWTLNKSQHRKVNSAEENSPAAPARIQTCNLLIRVQRSTNKLSWFPYIHPWPNKVKVG